MLNLAHPKKATLSLFGISFAESSFFPIPPDVMLSPLCIGNGKRWAWFAAVTTIGSVLGALLGYAIGYGFLDIALIIPSIEQNKIDGLANEFKERGQLYVFIAALTPIPFKLLTITAGTAKMNLAVFLMACITGRGTQSLPNCACAHQRKRTRGFDLMKLFVVISASPNKLDTLPPYHEPIARQFARSNQPLGCPISIN